MSETKYKFSIDFHPGHDSKTMEAPITWCKQKLQIETKPEDWVYKMWGVYESVNPLITDAQWQHICDNWETKYEGRARGCAKE